MKCEKNTNHSAQFQNKKSLEFKLLLPPLFTPIIKPYHLVIILTQPTLLFFRKHFNIAAKKRRGLARVNEIKFPHNNSTLLYAQHINV